MKFICKFNVISVVLFITFFFVTTPSIAVIIPIEFEVSGLANLYQRTNPDTVRQNSIDPVVVPGISLDAGQTIQIVASGCVVDSGSSCTGPDGFSQLFRGLPVYSLIGRWSLSPDVLDSTTLASDPFFVGSNAILTAPLEPGTYYLFLAENDGNFNDNAGAYTVAVIPEPASIFLFSIGAGFAGWLRRK